jgi:hypothetical protein
MKKRISKKLEELGMTSRVTNVYLSLLQQGVTGATKVARKLDRPKSSVLDDLNWLASQGFVSRHKKRNAFVFDADPSLLQTSLKKKRREIENLEEKAGLLAAELDTMYQIPSRKPQIEYLDGKDGVKAAYMDILKFPGAELVGYGDIQSELDVFPKLFPGYYKMRARNRIGGNGIIPASPQSLKECWSNDGEHLRQTRFVKLDKYHEIGFYVYEDNVSIISLKELFAVIIRSRAAARCLHLMFTLARKGAKEEDQEIRDWINNIGIDEAIKQSEKEFKQIKK